MAADGRVHPAAPMNEVDVDALRRRLARAQRDLRGLGAVDYGLLSEYARIDRRYQFLTEQLDDLAKTEAGIRETMDEVRGRIREQFMVAFEDVNARFKASFQELFQGGDADLVLTGEPGEPDCAVDVVAQPPGKRLHRMVALSGGERALVGAAMLLALIGANPSPFCILDEVDAALDELNVQRFLHAVRGMASQTQFILVTHNRSTMEMADALFGVTMSPGAVSQILAMRLSPAN
jgi:chromosome segregation protein